MTLNNNITSIGGSAFGYCEKLNLSSLPTNLEVLDSAAFMGCGEGLQITSIPNGVQTIKSFAFYGCPNVKISTFGSDDGTSKLNTIG